MTLKGVINLLDEKYYSTKEIADRFGVSSNTIRSLCENGEIGYIKIGTQYRISEKELNKYIQNQKENENNEKQ